MKSMRTSSEVAYRSLSHFYYKIPYEVSGPLWALMSDKVRDKVWQQVVRQIVESRFIPQSKELY
jgi:hypothetical protein